MPINYGANDITTSGSGLFITNGPASVACTTFIDSAAGSTIFLRKSRGTQESPTPISTDDTIGSIQFQGRNTNDLHVSSARIQAQCEIAPTGNIVAGRLHFALATEDATITDKMWLYSNGSLDIDGNTVRLRSSRTISSSTTTGNTGEVCWDNNYLYICIATNTWRRISLGSSF